MAYDLTGLSPEEMRELEESLTAFHRSESPMIHPDQSEDMAMIKPLVSALQALASRVDIIDRKVDEMSDHYFNQFIGGLTKLYDDNERSQGIETLRGKYGADFEPHSKLLGALLPEGSDIYGSMFDHIKSHYDEDDFDPDDFVDSILDEIEDKIQELRNGLEGGNPEKEKNPEEGGIEITATSRPHLVDLDEIRKSAMRNIKAG